MDSRQYVTQRPSDHFPGTSQSQDHGSMLPRHQPSHQYSSPRLPLSYPPRNVQSSHCQGNLPQSAHDRSEYRRHDEKNSDLSLPLPFSFQGYPTTSSRTYSDFPSYDNNSVQYNQMYDDLLPEMRHSNSTHDVFRSLPPDSHDTSYLGVHSGNLATPLSNEDMGSSALYLAPAMDIAPSRPNQTRASIACDYCRQYKAKCDEQHPCQNCRTKSLSCVYRIVPKKEAAHSELFNFLTFLKQEITTINQRVVKLEESLNDRRARSQSENARRAANVVEKMVLDDFEKDPGEQRNPEQPSLPEYTTAQASLDLLSW